MQFGEDAIVNEQEQEEETEADFSVTTYKVTMSEALKCFFCQCCGCYAVPPTQPGDRQSRFPFG
jgi:hypothetical protein